MENAAAVVDTYTECGILKAQGARVLRKPGSWKTPTPVNNDTLSIKRACSVNPHDSVCVAGKTPSNITQQLHQVHRMAVSAQYKGTRSIEQSLQRKIETNDRYNRANCERIVQTVKKNG